MGRIINWGIIGPGRIGQSEKRLKNVIKANYG